MSGPTIFEQNLILHVNCSYPMVLSNFCLGCSGQSEKLSKINNEVICVCNKVFFVRKL